MADRGRLRVTVLRAIRTAQMGRVITTASPRVTREGLTEQFQRSER